jgi:hypothetical protein
MASRQPSNFELVRYVRGTSLRLVTEVEMSKPSYEDLIGGLLSYEAFVRAHELAPLVDVKTACRIANLGHSRFYELAREGVFVLIRNGRRTNVSARNLYAHYLALIDGSRSPERRGCAPSAETHDGLTPAAPFRAALSRNAG